MPAAKYYGINIFNNILANGLNACILGLLIVIGCFAVRISYIRKLLYAFIIIAAALFGFEKINYENAYKLVMSEHVAKGGVVIVTSHILDWIEKICTRCIFVKDGKIVKDQPIQDLVLEDEYEMIYMR